MSKSSNKKETILIVDDTPLNVRLLQEMLTKNQYQVQTAEDGISALQMLDEHHVDLVLLDIKMPVMDGYEVCRRMKEDDKKRDIPVIFISALSDLEDIIKAFDTGGVDYITKPLKVREVIARVESQLTLLRQRQQIEHLRERDKQYYETLNNMKSQFIRAATHDLKNPLAVMVAYLGLLRQEFDPDDERLQYVLSIRESIDKMMGLVTEMLDLAQMESGLEIQREAVSLNDFIRKCHKDYFVQAQNKNIALELLLPEKDVTVQLDTTLMRRVFDNLLSNAVKYTPTGGHIDIGGEIIGDTVNLFVSDTGLGIPKSDIPNLFKAFYRVRQKEHMEIEGSGLGLSVVKSIVEQHGGEIVIESEPGLGSTFTVILPYTPVSTK